MPDTSFLLWLFLGGLAFMLATCIVHVITARVRHEIKRHDLIVESKRRRLEYLRSIAERQEGVVES